MAIVGTPTALEATELRKIAVDTKLQSDSVRPSIFTAVKTDFKSVGNEIIITKPGLVLDVTNVGKGQMGQSVRIGMRLPLDKRARYGDETVLSHEDESVLLFTEAFYNEIKKGVKMTTYGYNANDVAPYSFNEGYSDQLSNFHAENNDTRYQQAIVQSYSEELTYAPVSKKHQFNSNVALPNQAYASYPAWDKDDLTLSESAADSLGYTTRTYSGATAFAENLAAAMLAASGTGATPKATLTVDFLAEITTNVVDYHMVEPIMLDGVPSYIFKISPKVAGWMKNPNNTGSLAKYFMDIAAYKKGEERDLLPGEWGRIFEQFVLIVDARTPTLTVGGTAGSYTIVPGYIWPGNNDDRNNAAWSAASGATNYVFSACSILGANAVMKYTRDNMRGGLVETTEYDQIKGISTYMGEGIMIPAFDKHTQTDTSRVYRGSCLVPVSHATIAAHS